MMSVYEHQLIEKMQKGCQKSFDTIYSIYAKSLYCFASSRIKDVDVCNDLLQDVFASLWEKRSSLEITHSLKAYLYKSVRFKIIDYYRRNEKIIENIDDIEEHLFSVRETFVENIDSRNLLRRVLLTIEQLPTKMREIFMLSRFESLSINRIAERLCLSPQTVKNQISKALGILRGSCLYLV